MTEARKRFIENYVASFLGAWAAQNYDRFCFDGCPQNVIDIAPVEDAEYQAVETWNRMVDLRINITKEDW